MRFAAHLANQSAPQVVWHTPVRGCVWRSNLYFCSPLFSLYATAMTSLVKKLKGADANPSQGLYTNPALRSPAPDSDLWHERALVHRCILIKRTSRKLSYDRPIQFLRSMMLRNPQVLYSTASFANTIGSFKRSSCYRLRPLRNFCYI